MQITMNPLLCADKGEFITHSLALIVSNLQTALRLLQSA